MEVQTMKVCSVGNIVETVLEARLRNTFLLHLSRQPKRISNAFSFVYIAINIFSYSFFEIFSSYYLSDSSGLPISTDGRIVVQKRDGTCERHSWTLNTWMKVTGIRYQSKTRLYCVQKPKCKDI